eukprot:630596-Amphidinium_carterae.1
MAVMVFMSFDLSKALLLEVTYMRLGWQELSWRQTLDVMLDIEKMAKMTKIFLKKNPVEDEDLKDCVPLPRHSKLVQ